MFLEIFFLLMASFAISFCGSMLLWMRMTFFIDAMVHSLMLASVLYSVFDTPPPLAILLVVLLYIALLKLLGSFNNTNLIIASQLITILALRIKDNINFNKILFGSDIEINIYNIITLCVITGFIIYNIKAFIRHITLHKIQICTGLDRRFISYENYVLIIIAMLLPTVLFMGHTNIISLFILPVMISYNISNNMISMILYSWVITSIILCTVIIIQMPKFIIATSLFILYTLSQIIKKIYQLS